MKKLQNRIALLLGFCMMISAVCMLGVPRASAADGPDLPPEMPVQVSEYPPAGSETGFSNIANIEETVSKNVSISSEELSEDLRPYSKGDTILYRIKMTNNGESIIQTSKGKFLKVTIQNDSEGSRFDILDDIEITGIHAPIVEYPSSGGSQNEFKLQGSKKNDVLWEKGGTITFTLSYKVAGNESALKVDNLLTLSAPDTASVLWRGRVSADITKDEENSSEVVLTYHSNYPTAEDKTETRTEVNEAKSDAEFTLCTLEELGFAVPEGYIFLGWSLKRYSQDDDSPVADYKPQDTFRSHKDADLYAVWVKKPEGTPNPADTVKITYHDPTSTNEDLVGQPIPLQTGVATSQLMTWEQIKGDNNWSEPKGISDNMHLLGWSRHKEPLNSDNGWSPADVDYFDPKMDKELCEVEVNEKGEITAIASSVTISSNLDLYAVWAEGGMFGYTLTIPDANLGEKSSNGKDSEKYGDLLYYSVTSGTAPGAKKFYFSSKTFKEKDQVTVDIANPTTTRENTVFVAWYNKDAFRYSKGNNTTGTGDKYAFVTKGKEFIFKKTSNFHSLDAVWATMNVPSSTCYYDNKPHGLYRDDSGKISLTFLNLGHNDNKPNSQRNKELMGTVEISFEVSAVDAKGNTVKLNDKNDETISFDTAASESNGLVTYTSKEEMPKLVESGTYIFTITPKMKVYEGSVDDNNDVSRDNSAGNEYSLKPVNATLTILPRPVKITGSVEKEYNGELQTAGFNETPASSASVSDDTDADNVVVEGVEGGDPQKDSRGRINGDTVGFSASISGREIGTYKVFYNEINDEISESATEGMKSELDWKNPNYTVEPDISLIIRPTPSPTPNPTDSPSPSPVPSETPSPEETPIPSGTPDISPTPSPTVPPGGGIPLEPEITTSPSPDVSDRPQPTQSPSPVPSETPSPEGTPTPSGTPGISPTPSPTVPPGGGGLLETPSPPPDASDTPQPAPADTPPTGDSENLELWTALFMTSSAATAIVLMMYLRKQHTREKKNRKEM